MKYCDYGHWCKSVKRLPAPGGGASILCAYHFKKEMEWRRERNKHLAKENRFTIVLWDDLNEPKEV